MRCSRHPDQNQDEGLESTVRARPSGQGRVLCVLPGRGRGLRGGMGKATGEARGYVRRGQSSSCYSQRRGTYIPPSSAKNIPHECWDLARLCVCTCMRVHVLGVCVYLSVNVSLCISSSLHLLHYLPPAIFLILYRHGEVSLF